jgi:hypothetical protein
MDTYLINTCHYTACFLKNLKGQRQSELQRHHLLFIEILEMEFRSTAFAHIIDM